ncbi:MAG: ABC transporter permease [Synoicihabitans sp.]
MFSDFRLAIRGLIKSPGFTTVAVATLALCIGANSAIFSVVNAVLLQPLPYPDSERLAVVNNTYPGNGLDRAGVSIPDYMDRMERAPSIEDGALYTWESYNLSHEGAPIRFLGLRATPSLFTTLQVAPAMGRVFTEEEAKLGNDRFVVISHGLWRDSFASDPEVLGQDIRLNGELYQVIGVMPESFSYPQTNVRAWLPFAFTPEQLSIDERGNEYSDMLVRLRPGATPEMLSAECDAIVEQNLQAYPEFRPWVEASGFTGVAQALLESNTENIQGMLWLLQAGVVAALLIGCANVANLLLTRSLARQREFAIRSALGASRWTLIRQLLAESMTLFIVGGTLGAIVALWGISGMEALNFTDLPRGETVALDGTVFGFTLLCAGLTGLVFGLIPSLQASRPSAQEALQSGGTRTTGGRRQRAVRSALVVTEVALSLMLLTTAVLLTRSFQKLESQSPGFDPTSVLTARFSLPDYAYGEDHQLHTFANRLETELGSLPGVESVGLASMLPFAYGNSQGTYRIVGHEASEGAAPPHGMLRTATAGFFESLRIPVTRGRMFDERDHAESEQVVIVDQVLVDRYFPDEDPIGKQIYRGSDEPTPGNVRTIIGVVNSVKFSGLDDPVRKETIYYPFAQRPVTGLAISVRTSLPPSALIYSVRQTVLKIDPELPVYQFRTLEERISSSLQRQRTPMVLLMVFGLIALLLAALGVYGALAFSVGQRTQEMGIRMALGAAREDVMKLILGQGLRLVAIGSLIGLAGYLAVGRLLTHLLFEVRPIDPISFLAALAVLLVIAILACALPARRATRIDPAIALRDE